MAKEFRIIGPAGCGKTTTLRRRVDRFVDSREYAPEDIVLTSFSRAAAKELAGAVAVPRENVATLHSLARRVMGPQPIAEVGALAKQWDASGIPPAWKIGGKATADLDDGLANLDGDGSMLAAYSLARAKMLPAEHPTWDLLKPFYERWESFKRETDSFDFTDLLAYAVHEGGPAPGEPPVIFADEAQDFTSLSWRLIRQWANHPSVEKFYTCGDAGQTIFSWAGASPDEMLSPLPEGQQYVLPHGYRMPIAVQRHAEAYLARHSGTAMMAGREYTPWDGKTDSPRLDEGVVRRSSATWRTPDLVVAEAERLAAEGRSTLILATCAYMLEPTIAALKERGLLFQNPWRRSNSKWNPIGTAREGTVRTADRVAAFARGERPELWLPMLAATTFHTRGGKKNLVDAPEDWRQWTKTTASAAIDAHDLRWLLANITRDYLRPVEYAANLIARRGPEVLDAPVHINVGTMHSVKGGQADVCFLMPDVSVAGAEEMARGLPGRDAAIRLGYVGLSRAREEVAICSPAGRDELGI